MPNYKKLFKDILKDIEQCSTCIRTKVGAIIVKDGRIISTGWNGVPKGKDHCEHIFNFHTSSESRDNKTFLKVHHEFANENEIHAEENAIAYAARNGIKTNNAEIYISISPCVFCAKLICASGIKKVFYVKEYDRDRVGIKFLKNNNIVCEELK